MPRSKRQGSEGGCIKAPLAINDKFRESVFRNKVKMTRYQFKAVFEGLSLYELMQDWACEFGITVLQFPAQVISDNDKRIYLLARMYSNYDKGKLNSKQVNQLAKVRSDVAAGKYAHIKR